MEPIVTVERATLSENLLVIRAVKYWSFAYCRWSRAVIRVVSAEGISVDAKLVMFATATYEASDPDEYVSLIRGARIEVIASQRGIFNAEVTRVNLGDLWMQSGGESLARTFRVTTPTDRVILHFRRSPGCPTITLAAPVEYGEIALISPGQMGSWRSSDPCEWTSMSLPTEVFFRYGAVLAGRDLLPQDVQQVLRPSLTRFRRLCRLQRYIVDLSERAPWLLRQPDVTRSLQQRLIEVAFAAIGETVDQRSLQDRHHQRVMARFESLTEANPDRALYLTEVCEVVGVTERTFRNYCQRDFGMSPGRYLLLRRMHQARSALQVADRQAATVTQIATRFGFWELGRFAVTYHALFGETPSATLMRSAR